MDIAISKPAVLFPSEQKNAEENGKM